ncbi:hypothetical protein DENSPDRAFT_741540, partial [Dentipellis sp. KUC8613]
YLSRPDLLPDPRLETPWQKLCSGRNNHVFITTMGIDVPTFDLILCLGFATGWNSIPIPRHDVSAVGAPRVERRSLDVLGLILHYLNSTMCVTLLQEIFALIPSTVSRYLDFAMQIICDRHPALRGVFRYIDGLNLPVQESCDPEIQNATYSG